MGKLVSTNWLEKNLHKVKIFDATWCLPTSNRDPKKEFELRHIENSLFFDLDKFSNHYSDLPHMLPEAKDWGKNLSSLGIQNSDHIVIYDNSDVYSSCRVWYTFLYFGHNINLVSVLDGNFDKWVSEGRPVSKRLTNIKITYYDAKENPSMVLNKTQIKKNILEKNFQLIDARSKQRFLGLESEPRKGLKSGHIPGSKNLPFNLLLNKNRTFKKKEDLRSIFKKHKIDLDKDIAFTCGSGVTACILGMANSLINDKTPVVYDGSWSEFGQIKNETK